MFMKICVEKGNRGDCLANVLFRLGMSQVAKRANYETDKKRNTVIIRWNREGNYFKEQSVLL